MRASAFFTGLLMLIVGSVIFLFSYNAVQEFQTTAGQIARALDWLFGEAFGLEARYRILLMMEVVGGLIAIMGLVVTIYGVMPSHPAEDDKETLRTLGHEINWDYYFPTCPLCHVAKSIKVKSDFWSGTDYVYCTNCNAKWHVYIGPVDGKLKWAKLIEMDKNGIGYKLLDIRYEPEFWRSLAVQGLAEQDTLFCRYCGHKIPADSKFCIKCGKQQ